MSSLTLSHDKTASPPEQAAPQFHVMLGGKGKDGWQEATCKWRFPFIDQPSATENKSGQRGPRTKYYKIIATNTDGTLFRCLVIDYDEQLRAFVVCKNDEGANQEITLTPEALLALSAPLSTISLRRSSLITQVMARVQGWLEEFAQRYRGTAKAEAPRTT